MECYGELDCTVSIESLNQYGQQLSKRRNINNCFVKLGRDQFRDVVLKINYDTFILKDFKILPKFVKEGKATLLFTKLNTNIMFSNAPPDRLSVFLKLLRVKTGLQKTHANDRLRLYSTTSKAFEDISPLTLQDVKTFKDGTLLKSPLQQSGTSKAKQVSDITPLRTRKRGLELVDKRPRKKLHSAPVNIIKLGEKNILPKQCMSSRGKVVDLKTRVNLSEKLTSEQTDILNSVKHGYNIFFTGSAGTGKSYLLKRIIGALPPDTTVASASTGVAACQIGGITLHSFAGM